MRHWNEAMGPIRQFAPLLQCLIAQFLTGRQQCRLAQLVAGV